MHSALVTNELVGMVFIRWQKCCIFMRSCLLYAYVAPVRGERGGGGKITAIFKSFLVVRIKVYGNDNQILKRFGYTIR